MPIKIECYRGFANSNEIFLKGHAFKNYHIAPLKSSHGILNNFRNTLNRFSLKPLPGIEIKISMKSGSKTFITNNNGYFEACIPYEKLSDGWHTYKAEWQENETTTHAGIGEFLVLNKCESIIISDIDDTILKSYSTKILRKVFLQLTKNAFSRKPVKNISKIYKKWEVEQSKAFFYVSSSEWNLYDFLLDFSSINNFPKGVYLLKTLKKLSDLLRSGYGSHMHKYDKIEFLIEKFPKKRFVLIGDNTQHDPLIFFQALINHPKKIDAVFIHQAIKKQKATIHLQKYCKENQINFLLFNKSEELHERL